MAEPQQQIHPLEALRKFDQEREEARNAAKEQAVTGVASSDQRPVPDRDHSALSNIGFRARGATPPASSFSPARRHHRHKDKPYRYLFTLSDRTGSTEPCYNCWTPPGFRCQHSGQEHDWKVRHLRGAPFEAALVAPMCLRRRSPSSK